MTSARSHGKAAELSPRALQLPFALGHLANDWAPCAIWLLAPAVAAAMGLSPAEVGLLLAIHSVGAALAYLPAGILADRVADRGRLLLATFWWVAIGYAVAAWAPDFWTLAILLALAGMGDAAWHPIATGVLVKAMPERRAQVLGVHAAGGTLAEVLAPLTVGALLTVLDWRAALQISALPALLMGIAFIWLARRVPRADDGGFTLADVKALGRAWLTPAGLGVVATICLYNMALMAILAMTPLYLQTDQGFTPMASGLVFSGMVLVGAVAQPATGRLSDRIGRKPVFVVGASLAGLAAATAGLAEGTSAVIAALIAAAGLLVAVRSALLATAVEHAGRKEATTLGLAFVLMDGVGALGAGLAGLVGSVELRFAFLLAAGLSAAAVFTALTFAFSGRRQWTG